MDDPRYTAPVGKLLPAALPGELRAAMAALEARFAGLGLALFVFEFGGPGKGIAYISNAQRDGMIDTVEEWLNKQRAARN